MSIIHKKLTDKKRVINLLILGPYGKCQNKLQRLRDYLKSRGYKNTKLVIDFKDNRQTRGDTDIYFLGKVKTTSRIGRIFSYLCSTMNVTMIAYS